VGQIGVEPASLSPTAGLGDETERQEVGEDIPSTTLAEVAAATKTIHPPQGLGTIPSGWSDSVTFTITWDDPALMQNSETITGARYTIDVTPTGNYSGGLATNLVTISETMRITGVTLPDPVDGLHDVWVWLVAEDGTVDVTKATSTIYSYDATPPTVMIKAPEYVTVTSPLSDTSFEVSWQGFDLSPLTYTVNYRDTTWMTWTNWISTGTMTRSEFVSGMIGHSYVFSVTAENWVGLTAQDAVNRRSLSAPRSFCLWSCSPIPR
jgi:hypothetical protein